MKMPHWIMLVVVLHATVFLSACSNAPPRQLEHAERALDTHRSTTSQFHAALYHPAALGLQSDGYIVGIEKSPRTVIAAANDLNVKSVPDAGLSAAKARAKLDDYKYLFVSHILENNAADPAAYNCALYNFYTFDGTPPSARPCANGLASSGPGSTAFRASWTALDTLKAALTAKIASGRYTHLLVIVMGWNTSQEEALGNINAISDNLRRSAATPVNPLVIGVTWPSLWAGPGSVDARALDTATMLASFGPKAADADELGLSWLGVLLHDTITPALGRGDMTVVVIGHSFGARAVSTAACIGPAIQDGAHATGRVTLPYVVDLEGAFLATRLFGEDDDGFHYPRGCPNVRNLVLTASVADDAVKRAPFGIYAGDNRSFDAQCKNGPGRIRCAYANPDGTFRYAKPNPASSILYVNADQLINQRAADSPSGAHSDIYRIEHGRFLNEVLTSATSAQAPAATVAR